jgi:hypothetical protein
MMETPNGPDRQCPWCGLIHPAMCPRIKAIDYEGGLIKRIEFHSPALGMSAETVKPLSITLGQTIGGGLT